MTSRMIELTVAFIAGIGITCGIGHYNQQKTAELAWSAGYAAAYYADSNDGKSERIHQACNPLPNALNSDKTWNYFRCQHTMIALGESGD